MESLHLAIRRGKSSKFDEKVKELFADRHKEGKNMMENILSARAALEGHPKLDEFENQERAAAGGEEAGEGKEGSHKKKPATSRSKGTKAAKSASAEREFLKEVTCTVIALLAACIPRTGHCLSPGKDPSLSL